ncbi:MAG: hypothetical protein LBK52_00770, partial [Deltaproteobacteria bacterium]|nr:hypothetical protein [Deltaproteobacteria bacterium]
MQPINVVVLDQDPKNLPRIARALRPHGCGILWGENLADGRTLLAEARPKAVLASAFLPGLENPGELLEICDQLKLEAAVILMAQQPDFDDAMDWVSQGILTVLQLPLNPERLRQVFGRLSDSRPFSRNTGKESAPDREKSLILYRSLAGHLESGELMSSLAETACTLTGASRAEAWAGSDFLSQQKHSAGEPAAANFEITL